RRLAAAFWRPARSPKRQARLRDFHQAARTRADTFGGLVLLARRQAVDHVATHVRPRRAHRRDEASFDKLHFDVIAALAPVFLNPLLKAPGAVHIAEIVIHSAYHLLITAPG